MHLKSELMKLVKSSTELIDIELIGLKSFQYSFFNSSDSSSKSNFTHSAAASSSTPENPASSATILSDSYIAEIDLISSQHGITYEQLQAIIEETLTENNYHSDNLKYLR